METRDAERRFRDPAVDISSVLSHILVRCPGCQGKASVVLAPGSDLEWGSASWSDRVFAKRRLVCSSCGYTGSWPRAGSPPEVQWRPGVDPYFGTELWLIGACCGRQLWAYNEEHLLLLRHFVRAELRERGSVAPDSGDRWETLTLLEALPSWMKEAGHRDEVVRTIDRLLNR